MREVGASSRFIAAGAVFALGLGGCGSNQRQDAKEKKASYRVAIVESSFPSTQRLAESASMRIGVRNASSKPIPNVAVTVQAGKGSETGSGSPAAFAETSSQQGLANPSRPVWVLDAGPRGGSTAYVNTWALGRLRPGETKTFSWKVTAVKAGVHTVRYRVAAGLNGKATAVLNGGGEPTGSFVVSVSRKPADARVGAGGEIITIPR